MISLLVVYRYFVYYDLVGPKIVNWSLLNCVMKMISVPKDGSFQGSINYKVGKRIIDFIDVQLKEFMTSGNITDPNKLGTK